MGFFYFALQVLHLILQFIDTIEELKETNITDDSKWTIIKIRGFYNSLSSEQQDTVTNYSTLNEAEVALTEYLIDLLPDEYSVDDLYFRNRIEELISYYDQLSPNQQEQISNLSKLEEAKIRLVNLIVNKLSTDGITLDNQEEIKYAKNNSDLIESEESLEKLEGLVFQLEELLLNYEVVVNHMNMLIENLPSKEEVNYWHEEDILRVSNFYNSLSDYERGLINPDLQTKLQNAVNALNDSIIDFYTVVSIPFTDLNFTNQYELNYFSDGERIVMVPLYQKFATIDDLKSYIEEYFITNNFSVNIEVINENQIQIKPEHPNLQLEVFSSLFEQFL